VDEALALAHELANLAAAVQKRYFRASVTVEAKADLSPVTIADREAEAVMRAAIRRRFPGHGILGEEHGSEATDAEHVWVLDPIDGTRSFITGRPLFGTLIALLEAGRPVLGVIDHALLGERWVGVAGRPTTHNGTPVRVRPCAALGDAVLLATHPRMFAAGPERAAFERVEAAARLSLYGSDCYAYGLLALGTADLVVEAAMQPFDYLALVPVVEGAGGRVTGWAGEPLGIVSAGRVLAAGDARLHAAARALLAPLGAGP
jgi:inositol-phosphate phosphatase/L-galactose 1-phosphate phosphatase/histidinol-phosphatase